MNFDRLGFSGKEWRGTDCSLQFNTVMRIKAVDDAVMNVLALSNDAHNAAKCPAQAISYIHLRGIILMPLDGLQEACLACKNWVMRHGYLSGARCKWLGYGLADATAIPSSLASVKSRMVYASSTGLTRLSWKKDVNQLLLCNIHQITSWRLGTITTCCKQNDKCLHNDVISNSTTMQIPKQWLHVF